MIEVKKEGILLEKTQLEFENEGVLNPAVIREGDTVHLFYRAVKQGNYSTIGYCKLDGPLTVTKRLNKPIIVPECDYETHGVEDPRIVKIDGLYYLTYTGYDGTNARGALATSKDLKKFKKHGVIVPPITYSEFVYLAESAGKVHELLCERPPSMTGLRLITEVRRNFRGYYDWVNENGSQDLFFAGRSVLHRIDADIHARTESSAEAIILRRLREGSKIRIDFLDPRSDIIDRLAQEEGETPAALLGNIATSLGICRRLGELVRAHYLSLPAGAVLSVRVYDRMPYFAYHKQDNDVLVGFYFQSLLGSSSAAYELVDETTKRTFSEHFVRIHADAASTTMVEFDGAAGRPLFNNELFNELRKQLSAKLGPSRVDELLAGRFADEQPGLSQPSAAPA